MAADYTFSKMLDIYTKQASADIDEPAQSCKRYEPSRGPDDIPIAVVRNIYDPAGFVYEATMDNRLPGVTATVLYAPTSDGPWEVWNAEWYLQESPLVTDSQGRYAWDVPIGFWQVRYDAAGYATAYSDVLEVFPPHFDVDVGLVSTRAPATPKLAGAVHAPILLTEAASLPRATAAAPKVLFSGVVKGTIYVIGGTDSISAAVASQMRSIASTASGHAVTVVRVAGKNRHATSADMAAKAGKIGAFSLTAGGLKLKTAFLASGQINADALSAGSASFGLRIRRY